MHVLAAAPADAATVCLPWGCDLRDKCALNMEARGVVIVTYFHPPHVGEFCPFYSPEEKRT